MADVATNDAPNIDTVAKRSMKYIQYEITNRYQEITKLQAEIRALQKAKDLVEDTGNEIGKEWDRQKKVDTAPVA
jgi:hypothetical protein